MKREIKFRAWDNKNKLWLLGYEMPNLGGFSLFGEIMLLGEWGSVLDRFIFERLGEKAEDLIVMQYTGLLDKNSKEIYEGDIVSDGLNKDVIEWNDTDAGWDTKDGWIPILSRGMHHAQEYVKIIGNIYENPELLNETSASIHN